MLVTGYDLDCLTWGELVSTAAPSAPIASVPVDLRSHVAAGHHDELEMLVADARNAVQLRDDNGALTAAWPMGLLRRAMMAAGHRSCPTDPSLAVEATVDELVLLLAGRGSVTVEQLDLRRRERDANSAHDAPPTIGPEFAIPPLEALPPPAGADRRRATGDRRAHARRQACRHRRRLLHRSGTRRRRPNGGDGHVRTR